MKAAALVTSLLVSTSARTLGAKVEEEYGSECSRSGARRTRGRVSILSGCLVCLVCLVLLVLSRSAGSGGIEGLGEAWPRA